MQVSLQGFCCLFNAIKSGWLRNAFSLHFYFWDGCVCVFKQKMTIFLFGVVDLKPSVSLCVDKNAFSIDFTFNNAIKHATKPTATIHIS